MKIYISVTDKNKLNDLQKSKAIGLFYVHSEFDALSSSYLEKCGILTHWVRDLLQPLHGKYLEHQNRIAQREMMCEQVYEI